MQITKLQITKLLNLLALLALVPSLQAATPTYGYQIVHIYPHDPAAFTEGLFYLNGYLYEATGLENQSSIRKVKLETGEVLQEHHLPAQYFGEGIVKWKDKLYQMTWLSEVGFVYDFNTFEETGEFHYEGQGWAFTTDGRQIYMDGTRALNADAGDPDIRIWDPDTLKEIGVVHVTDDGHPVYDLNELEWVKGEIFANVWHTTRIARIDPKTGNVTGWIDLSGLLEYARRAAGASGAGSIDVLNGIAYDAEHDRLFVTGKLWPKLFEIKVVKKGAR